MKMPYEESMDRATLNYLISRSSEEWHGFILEIENPEKRTAIKNGLDGILENYRHTSSQNGSKLLSQITDSNTDSIVYFAGTYGKETINKIKNYLEENKLDYKTIQKSYEFFINGSNPYWVKRTLNLLPKTVH